MRVWLEDQWSRHGLLPEVVVERLLEACLAEVGQEPEARFDALIEPLAPRLDAPTACEVLDQLVHLIGKPGAEVCNDRPGLLA